MSTSHLLPVVLDTTKVQIFKQITTLRLQNSISLMVVLNTTKVQIFKQITTASTFGFLIGSCFRYHKGTDFQANHNLLLVTVIVAPVVLDTTKVQIFKQITTYVCDICKFFCCFRYHKGTDFQANHNQSYYCKFYSWVVLDTTKVQIFKQITTRLNREDTMFSLFQIPQRYRFSSKSQLRKLTEYIDGLLFQIPQRYRFSSKSQHYGIGELTANCCFRYHKGTDFQANHNRCRFVCCCSFVVLDTTKVQIFKQITTPLSRTSIQICCFRYHKGTDFQANHNGFHLDRIVTEVVLDTTKVQIFKQITT